jgi:hypothetical protein
MKKILLALVAVAAIMTAQAQGIKTPAPSPTQTIKQDFALSSIRSKLFKTQHEGQNCIW